MRFFTITKSLFIVVSFSLLVRTAKAQNEISPYMYGVNAWLPNQVGGGDGGNIVNLGGILDQLWDRVGEGNPRIIRIGGIAYDDNRPSTDQYVGWINAIRAVGAEPLVQVARGKDNNSTSAQAAALVNELNNVRGLNIRFWSIANEPDFHYFNFNLSDPNMQIITDYIKEYSDAMKGQDPNIIIAGAAFSNWKTEMPKLLQSGTLDISGISPVTNRPYIDVFDWHYYPIVQDCYTFDQAINTPGAIGDITGCNGTNWYGLRGKLQELEVLLNDANSRHGRTGTTALKWGISEFHITVSNPGGAKDAQGTTSFLAGQYWADVMSISAEFGGEYVIGWSTHESGGANTEFDLGILGANDGTEKRSTYYHMKMLSDDMSGEFLTSTNNFSDVKTFAAKDGDTYKILVMNQGRNNNGYNFDISFNNTADNQLEINVDASVAINYTGFINERETKLFVFTVGENDPDKVVTYNLERYEADLPPLVVNPGTVGTNLLTNGMFDDGLVGWDTFINEATAMGTFNVNSTGSLEANITNGGTNNWNVQLNQLGLTLENGKTYMLSFDASAVAPRIISVSLQQNVDPFADYGGPGAIDLSTEVQNFSDTFTMTAPTDPNARLTFNLGLDNNNVIIDNVILKEVTTLGINTISLSKDFNIYPVPAKNLITIENTSNVSIQRVEIYDVRGKMIMHKKLNTNTVDISSMESGIYLLAIQTSSGAVWKKIVKD